MLERLLTKLERRFGRYALGNVTYVLVGLQAIGFIIVMTRPDLAERLVLDRAAVLNGQWWRLLSFLLSPVATHPIWVIFALYWLYTMGTALEEHWGSFRYELFWILGIAATYAAVFVGGSTATVAPLVMSLFLAFATLWPNYPLRIFFILPVPVKWLALLDACFIAVDIGWRQGLDRLVPLAAVANYLLFFGPTLWRIVRGCVKAVVDAPVRAFVTARVKGNRSEPHVAAPSAARAAKTPPWSCACARVRSAVGWTETCAWSTRATTEAPREGAGAA
jgi:hypothetical protein